MIDIVQYAVFYFLFFIFLNIIQFYLFIFLFYLFIFSSRDL